MPDAEERQRKSLYLQFMWDLAEQLTGCEAVPGDVDPVLVRARKDIDRWWPKLKDRGDRTQLIERALEQTDKGDRHAPWLYFRKVVNGLIAERAPDPDPVVGQFTSRCHIHGWYLARDIEKHAHCSYEGES